MLFVVVVVVVVVVAQVQQSTSTTASSVSVTLLKFNLFLACLNICRCIQTLSCNKTIVVILDETRLALATVLGPFGVHLLKFIPCYNSISKSSPDSSPVQSPIHVYTDHRTPVGN